MPENTGQASAAHGTACVTGICGFGGASCEARTQDNCRQLVPCQVLQTGQGRNRQGQRWAEQGQGGVGGGGPDKGRAYRGAEATQLPIRHAHALMFAHANVLGCLF